GDANYRRCIGDAHWPYTTPFNQVVSYFPAPLLTLRTCKSNALIGLSPGRQAQLDSQHPNWIISGQWSVIQFVDSR
ncbi:MAG: protein-glutamate O-methyltransferase family protein, partial [Chloroflexi bacterium]|nr:protein-glutamate O-methyltransferase family protein [Chloroflexota bacterium]